MVGSPQPRNMEYALNHIGIRIMVLNYIPSLRTFGSSEYHRRGLKGGWGACHTSYKVLSTLPAGAKDMHPALGSQDAAVIC